MGTNYYGRIIPSAERKEKIKKVISDGNFKEIKHLIDKTYGRIGFDYDENELTGGEVHLGKNSSGWKFLWNPNIYQRNKGHMEWKEIEKGHKIGHYVPDGYDVLKVYDLNKESIKAFIDREDVEIYDEYGDKQDKEQFWELALKQNPDDWDGDAYSEFEIEKYGRVPYNYSNSDYCKFLRELGYTLGKWGTDFYSDGLRFATNTGFS